MPHVPNGIDIYFEPFFGGGALFWYIEPERAVVSDINQRLITFYRQLSENPSLFLNQLAGLEANYGEDLYYKMREEFNRPTGKYLEGVVYYFINKTAYAGMTRYNANGEFNVPFGKYKHFTYAGITDKHVGLLQRTSVLQSDYTSSFAMAGNGDFLFLDPPYDCVFHSYGNTMQEDNESFHRRLAADYRNLSSRALMIINKTPLTQELYRRYIAEEYEKKYAVNIKNRFKQNAVHLVIKNYKG